MQGASTPRRGPDADRFQLSLAVGLAAAAIAGGIFLGHGPADAQNTPTQTASAVQATRVGAGADRSLPDAARALEAAPQDASAPTATF